MQVGLTTLIRKNLNHKKDMNQLLKTEFRLQVLSIAFIMRFHSIKPI